MSEKKEIRFDEFYPKYRKKLLDISNKWWCPNKIGAIIRAIIKAIDTVLGVLPEFGDQTVYSSASLRTAPKYLGDVMVEDI